MQISIDVNEGGFARVKTEQRLWDVIFREKPNPFFYGYRESLYRKVIVQLLHKSSGRRASVQDGNLFNPSARDWQAPVAETPEPGREGRVLGYHLDYSAILSMITLKYAQDLSVEIHRQRGGKWRGPNFSSTGEIR